MSKRKVGNGEGSLYYSEKLQKWIFQYVIDGKRHTVKQKNNEKVKDFKARVTQIKNDINQNTFVNNSDITLYTLLKSYIDNKYKNGIIQDRTYRRDNDTLKLLNKCCNKLLNKPVQKITIYDIQKELPNLIENDHKTYSQSVINKVYAFLVKGFKIAISQRIITYNLMENENIKRPKSKKENNKVLALTLDEEIKLINILKEIKHKYSDIVLLDLVTGARIGEILAIRKDKIDLSDYSIIIDATLTRDINDKVILGNKTKTSSGKRKIYVMDNGKEILERLYKSSIHNIYNLVFYDYEKNTFITPNEINCFLRRLNDKYKICKHLHTHMLRHSFATRCIEAGMSPKVLQKNLGHSKIDITLDTYTDVFEKFNKEENEKYNTYMKISMQ